MVDNHHIDHFGSFISVWSSSVQNQSNFCQKAFRTNGIQLFWSLVFHLYRCAFFLDLNHADYPHRIADDQCWSSSAS